MTRPSENLRLYAIALCGIPYIWGGSNPVQGMDCSAFAQELLASEGLDPPGDQTAQGLFDHFKSRSVTDDRALGALVFYGKSVKQISHVAMMISEFQIIEAGGGGSKTLTKEDAAKQSAFTRIRHIDRRSDIVAILNPFVIAKV